MSAWLRTTPDRWRATLERVSFEAEGLWHTIRLYCAATGNNGRLAKRELHIAVARKISAGRAARLADELAAAGGLLIDLGDAYELVDWLEEQPEAEVWHDDVKRERWARNKALRRDRALCIRIQTRDHNRCRYCGTRVNWLDRKGPTGGTYDHVDPDGANTVTNVVVACRRCNSRKRDRTPAQAGMMLLPPGTRPANEVLDPDLDAGDPDLLALTIEAIQGGQISSPDPTGVRPESDPRPGSLACAREAGPNQTATRSGQTADAEPAPPPSPSDVDAPPDLEQMQHPEENVDG